MADEPADRWEKWFGKDKMRFWTLGSQTVLSAATLVFALVQLFKGGATSVYVPILTAVAGINVPSGAFTGLPERRPEAAAVAAAAAQDLKMTVIKLGIQNVFSLAVMIASMVMVGRALDKAKAQEMEMLAGGKSMADLDAKQLQQLADIKQSLQVTESIFIPIIMAIFGYAMPAPGNSKALPPAAAAGGADGNVPGGGGVGGDGVAGGVVAANAVAGGVVDVNIAGGNGAAVDAAALDAPLLNHHGV